MGRGGFPGVRHGIVAEVPAAARVRGVLAKFGGNNHLTGCQDGFYKTMGTAAPGRVGRDWVARGRLAKFH